MNDTATSPRVGAAWKANWDETKKHFIDWWARKGFVISGGCSVTVDTPRTDAPDPGPAASLEDARINAPWRIASQHYRLSRAAFPLDILPVAGFDLGPGVLGLYMGSEPNFTLY